LPIGKSVSLKPAAEGARQTNHLREKSALAGRRNGRKIGLNSVTALKNAPL
jgi:hypothetical protein